MHVAPEYFIGLPKNEQKVLVTEYNQTFEEKVLNTISLALGVNKEQIYSPSRKRTVTEARCIAIGIILARIPNYGLKKLGKLFGGRDHSTILYGKDLYNDLYGRDKTFTFKANLVLKGIEL